MLDLQTFDQAFATLGRGQCPFLDDANPDRPIVLHTYRPATFTAERPVVIVQHGMLRNGDQYRDFWIEAAERHGLLIVAPTFGTEHHPEPRHYNNGLVLDDAGAVRPRATWTYGVPARVFAALRAAGITNRTQAHLFGHSAGGQFAHRLMATQPHDPFAAVTAGNPGWYTLPTQERPFPEGLGGLGLEPADVARWLAYPMTVLAGDQDIVTDDPNLPSNPEALAQGPHRYARARFFVDFGRAAAAALGVACSWQLVRVPGVGHDGAAMGVAAAGLWFEGKLPEGIAAGFAA